MKYIVWGIIFLLAALLVVIADNVSLLGFLDITNTALRWVVALALGFLGIIFLSMGLKKRVGQ